MQINCILIITTLPTLSAGTSKLITSSNPFHPPRYLPPCTSDSAFADTVRFLSPHADRHAGDILFTVFCLSVCVSAGYW